MADSAQSPIDILTTLRKSLQLVTPTETAITRATRGAATLSAGAGLAETVIDLIENANLPRSIGLGFLRAAEKAMDLDFWHMENGSPTMGKGPNRQAGGKVEAGKPYIIGETGPERFMPKVGGQIVPGAGNVQIQFNSPIQIVGADGGIVTVGHFNKLFDQKIEQAAINRPNPVSIA